MYAYCFNNPVNNSDPTGNWPKWLENAVSAVEKKAKDIVSSVKKKVSSINWGRVADKAIRATKAVTNNVEISAGIGLGLMAKANVADIAELGLGATYNLVQVTIDDGAVSVEQSSFIGMSASVGPLDLLPNAGEYSTRKLSASGEIGKFKPKNDQNWTIFGASAYFFAGGSVYIGFDVNSFCQNCRKHFLVFCIKRCRRIFKQECCFVIDWHWH